jgi:NAD(P)-dependent dehydrogenase (short-subunit alcohol dehydrogenase family)
LLLTNLLLNELEASAPARVLTLASMAHAGAKAPCDDMNNRTGLWRSFKVYGQTKLMNIMFTYELTRRLAGSRVTANAVHPGFVASHFGKSNGGFWPGIFALAQPFTISVQEGARASIYLASSPDVADTTGQYFVRSKPATTSPESYDQHAQQRLWRVSAEMTGLADAG